MASGDSAVIKARPVARASRPRGTTNDAAPAPEIQQRLEQRPGSRKGLLRQVERIACAMVRTSAPRKNETQWPESRGSWSVCRALRTCATLLRSFFEPVSLDPPPFTGLELRPVDDFQLVILFFSRCSETSEDSNDEANINQRRIDSSEFSRSSVHLCIFVFLLEMNYIVFLGRGGEEWH